MKYQSIIGLEVHIELKTKSKMFCSCSTDYFGKPPNSHVCPICLGLPGTLPVPNKKAIEWCVTAGMALNCKIPHLSKFDRKNYFYPDLPKGYQISQYDEPFARNGELKLKMPASQDSLGIKNEKLKIIRIRRVHLEEDTAKLIHTKGKFTLIDFNRSGVPLMEVVSEPDIKSPQEAKDYLKKLRQVIRYLEVSDCDMEKGSMRCEANVSLCNIKNQKASFRGFLRNAKIKKLPDYKVEIKNLNSFRFVEKAIEYEIERQKKLLEAGKKLTQETRGWDQIKQVTFLQRVKETAADYRYFPEPDIPPISWTKSQISNLKSQIPELPDEKIERFVREYRLSDYQSDILVATKKTADYFEMAVKVGKKYGISALEIANIIVNKRVDTDRYLPSGLIKSLLRKKKGQISDQKQIRKSVKKVLLENPKAVEDYKRGKTSALEFLMGQVLRLTKGKIEPKVTRNILLKHLK